jgi:hypothetical protein
MSNDLEKTDGFEGFESGVEGQEAQGRGVIRGACVRFTNEATWTINDGEELPSDLELVAVDVIRVVQKWINQMPVETRILAPGEKFPDLKALNETAPKNEWTEVEGKLRGPWQAQHVVYLINPTTLDRYSYPTGTTGGAIAVRELVDKTKWMRSFRGANVYAVVTLSDVFMNTRFGGRQRPHFVIKRWIMLGPKETALPAPTPEIAKPAADADLRTVEPPSCAEEMNDEIPHLGNETTPAVTTTVTRAPRKPAAQKPRVTKRGVQRIAGSRR